jgi:catechol 2,3-dioxygenase-like lactoylglutathione lyase family enzyme
MASYLGEVVINVNDLERGLAFWTAALNYEVADRNDRIVILRDPSREWVRVSVQLTDQPKSGLNRVHIDLYSTEPAAEISRLEKLGAKRLEWNYEPGARFTVLADPDGNEFCIVES